MTTESPFISENGYVRLKPELAQGLLELMSTQEERKAHSRYYKLAQSHYLSSRPNFDEVQLTEAHHRGFAKLPGLIHEKDRQALVEFLDQSVASNISESPEEVVRIGKLEKKLKAKLNTHEVRMTSANLPRLQEIIQNILRPEIVDYLERTMLSHFKLSHVLLYRAFPTDEPSGSFRWHRDYAPQGQTHIMGYLTDSKMDGSGGATEFLPLRESQEMAKRGYSFPWETRVCDLKEVQADDQIVREIQRPHLKPGDGVLFSASRVLHRGIAPVATHRDVFTLVLLPHLNPWNKTAERFGLSHLLQRSYGWDEMLCNPDGI